MPSEEPGVESVDRRARRCSVSGGPRIAVGALAMVIIATFGAPSAARGVEPPSPRSRPEAPAGPVPVTRNAPAGGAAAAVGPVFTCRIPHAVASTALGVFATSLTLWTRVSDTDPAHVAAVVWLEPPIIGALYGIDAAAASPVGAAGRTRMPALP